MILIGVATYCTVAVEFFIGIAVWIKELRSYAISLCIALHLVIKVVLNLQLFGWIMISSMVLFM
jgi:hypothetical protein